MKKLLSMTMIAAAVSILSSCGVSHSIILNNNQNSTQVQLSQSNYKVISRVTGTASVPYILMIGGINRKQLFDNAYSDMMNKAGISGGSKAIINVITEEHLGGVPPFYYKRTVTVSCNVIEFVK